MDWERKFPPSLIEAMRTLVIFVPEAVTETDSIP
jgi:hypothetical protein